MKREGRNKLGRTRLFVWAAGNEVDLETDNENVRRFHVAATSKSTVAATL